MFLQIAEAGSLKELKKRFDPELVDRALVLAASKTAQKTRTFIGREVRAVFDIGQTSLNKNTGISIKKGNKSLLLLYKGSRIGLGHFGLQVTEGIKGFDAVMQRQMRIKRDGSYSSKIITTNRRRKTLASSGIRVRIKNKVGYKKVRAQRRYGQAGQIKNDPFISKMPNMSRDSVFVRRANKRLPIVHLTGPSFPQMITSTDVMQKAFKFIEKEHGQQFSDHLDKLQQGIIR